MTLDQTLAHLHSLGNAADAAESARYHKTTRTVLGIKVPVLADLARDLRQSLALDDRLALASDLWDADIHEARVLAAKLLEQARIRPDDSGAWDLIQSWVPDFDGWAIADHVCIAGQKRLVANPARLDTVETWTTSPDKWTRRAALVITLPWTKQNLPKPEVLVARDRILGWAAGYVSDPDWFIQKSVGGWLRDLSRHDPERVIGFLGAHGDAMKPFARAEARQHLE